MTYLVAQGLRKSYGAHEVVAGIDLELRRGECFGLLGPNGAGKTTTLRLCLGLTDPDGGTINMFDLPVPQAAREARARVGVVPLMDNLVPDFSVRDISASRPHTSTSAFPRCWNSPASPIAPATISRRYQAA
jgi:lipooligosaccharide transport system ATP-binding protein